MRQFDIYITKKKLICGAFLAICLLALNGWGQVSTAGIITGTVSDNTGAVIPDAEITIKNQDTNVPTIKKTDGSGVFAAPSLNAGTYSISITKTGFHTYTESGIILHPTQVATVNATLQIGQVGTHVNVVGEVAAAAEVRTSTSEISSEVSGTQVQTLPLNGRNFESLAAVMPGVVNMSPGRAQTDGSLSETNSMSINGMSASGNLTTLDGIWNENSGNMEEMTVTPNPNTIDEVAFCKITSVCATALWARTW